MKVVRLVDGYSYSEGRVEIKVNGLWNTICDPNWNIDKANDVCNLLGFSGAVDLFQNAYFGEGSGPLRIMNAHCSKFDTILADSCFLSSQANTNCSHRNDVGVICFRKIANKFINRLKNN